MDNMAHSCVCFISKKRRERPITVTLGGGLCLTTYFIYCILCAFLVIFHRNGTVQRVVVGKICSCEREIGNLNTLVYDVIER